MRQAAGDACAFAENMTLDQFLQDKRTQQAVIMSLVIIGEAATRLMAQYPDFCAEHADIPWRNMRGMRNRIAHGYFEVNLKIVWGTVQSALPALLGQLERLGPT
jgi:uncharacterized protein with HEPN domain